jgi:CheY-like chemotaxis protein
LDAAESASKAKSAFLANMSHELRTPLNGVMGVASALAGTRLTARQREMVGIIESSSQTLEALLSDVLDLAKIEAGHLELKSEPFDFALAARTCATLFAPAAKAKGLDFHLEIEPSAEGLFEGDGARIRQILSNLLSNAVKFTSAGVVRLTVSAEPARGGALLQASVSDSGIGFDAETKDRLFNRFEQADGSITRRFGGTGLGLAISRSLAEAMGGELDADAAPGHGARFTLSVRLQPCARLQTSPEPSAPDASADDTALQRTPRVLVAEDHPTNRRVVELILGAAGVELTCVENGEEAVAASAHEDFDLILMDMQMPVMDGLTAIGLIRGREMREGRTRTPIYSLTANAMAEHGQASLDAGADGHITKPINAGALLAIVSAACAGRDRHEAEAPRRATG